MVRFTSFLGLLLSRFSLVLKIIVKYKMQTSIQGFGKEVMLNPIMRQW
jgi:hypothetical protein